MDLRKLKSILELFNAADIAEMKISSGDENVHLIRSAPTPTPAPAPAATTAAPTPTPAPAAASAATATPPPAEENGAAVPAPMVGTFYRSPSPERPPFVQAGQRVEKGQTICIIEAMKLMNEIPSPVNGVVRSIVAENGQPVSYGETLMIIE